VANVLRAFVIVVVAYVSDMRLATGIDHIIYGWMFFGMVMFVLFYIGSRFRDSNQAIFGTTAFDRGKRKTKASNTASLLATAVAATMVSVSSPIAAKRFAVEHEGDAVKWHVPALPSDLARWLGPKQVNGGWRPLYNGADASLVGSYENKAGEVRVYIAYYFNQQQRAELIRSGNKIYSSDRWIRKSYSEQTIELGDDEHRVVNVARLDDGRVYMLIWYWYEIGGHVTTNKVRAKLVEAWLGIRRKPFSSALFAVAVSGSGQAPSGELLRGFLKDNYQKLARCLSECVTAK
jgi:EpsI family protein